MTPMNASRWWRGAAVISVLVALVGLVAYDIPSLVKVRRVSRPVLDRAR